MNDIELFMKNGLHKDDKNYLFKPDFGYTQRHYLENLIENLSKDKIVVFIGIHKTPKNSEIECFDNVDFVKDMKTFRFDKSVYYIPQHTLSFRSDPKDVRAFCRMLIKSGKQVVLIMRHFDFLDNLKSKKSKAAFYISEFTNRKILFMPAKGSPVLCFSIMKILNKNADYQKFIRKVCVKGYREDKFGCRHWANDRFTRKGLNLMTRYFRRIVFNA